MRRIFSLSAVLLILVASSAVAGVDKWIGTIASSGSVTDNTTTATPFKLGAHWKVMVQCDAPTYIKADSQGRAPVVTALIGEKLATDGMFDAEMYTQDDPSAQWYVISILPVSGSANCKVFVSSYN